MADKTSASLVIRPATHADLPAADALERANFQSHNISLRQLRYLQRNPRASFLVAAKRGEVIGDAIALVRRHPTGARSGRIYSIVVDSAHRGEKIGQKLMAQLIARLRRQRVARIFLEVEKTNAGAVRLYERLGFRITGTLRHYYGRSKHGLRMTLDPTSL